MAHISVPRIKEPNFFFVGRKHDSPVLTTLLSLGNFSRDLEWYKDLYQFHGPDCLLVDFSTQYWLYPEQTIENARKAFDPRFIVLKRPRIEQLISYISHLRRGHIKCDRISSLYKSDAGFSKYLDRMSHWNDEYEKIRTKFPDEHFLDVSFEELISNPTPIIQKIFPGVAIENELTGKVQKNPKSYPRFELFNKIVFSNMARKIGRVLPQFMYSGLIRLRKASVKMNLKKGHGKHFDDDRNFIIKTYS